MPHKIIIQHASNGTQPSKYHTIVIFANITTLQANTITVNKIQGRFYRGACSYERSTNGVLQYDHNTQVAIYEGEVDIKVLGPCHKRLRYITYV